jgi:RNA polymerase sigma factor (sigma-70 family)
MGSGAAVRAAEEPLRWLYTVVDRCCFDVLRRRRRSPVTLAPDEGAGRHPGVEIELRDAVLRLLGALDEDQMRIAVLLFVDGMSQGEIADEVGVSRVTVNKRIQSIRARAEAWLEGHS